MHSKERVIRTLRFQQPDRIPVDLWVLPALSIRYGDALQELLDRNVIDIARAPYNDPTFDERHYRIGSSRDAQARCWASSRGGLPMEH